MSVEAAAWVQALAAAVQAGAAVILLKVTRDYVKLTQRLAVAGEAQVEILRAARDEQHSEPLREMAETARHLLNALRQLPGPGEEARQRANTLIRGAVLPPDEELARLRSLAAKVGPSVAQYARSASENLAWLLQRARDIQNVSPSLGYDFQKIKWPEWVFRYTEAEQALTRLAAG